jgi:hypothetical protein
MRARFGGRAFAKHRHDTYAICVTEVGLQLFDYRGRVERSRPGQVTVLHPDEPHDGRPGTEGGFGYRIVYVDPARIADAVRAIRGRPGPLPFVREPVAHDPALARAVAAAFRSPLEPLALDAVVLQLAEGLLAAAGEPLPGDAPASAPPADMARRPAAEVPTGTLRGVDVTALERARSFLRRRSTIVHSPELARQFRACYGTSPYRYSVMRRLDLARRRLRGGMRLVDVALTAGFADQAHFTRAFRSAYGITPGRFARLHTADER